MPDKSNRKLVLRLLLISVSTFFFGVFAMPPLYAKFCEITGIGQAGVRLGKAPEVSLVSDRKVTILLDANANSELPWEFEPVERRVTVNIGEASETSYRVLSLVDKETSGRAVYNVSPPEAARHFVKTECFCFSQQNLAAGQEKVMPVRFYIDPELPEDIPEITLSYTFFLNQGDAGTTAATAD